jgi:flavin reductase (DIM6/NTAB) family NADH-FMN oxidoreductase RutF
MAADSRIGICKRPLFSATMNEHLLTAMNMVFASNVRTLQRAIEGSDLNLVDPLIGPASAGFKVTVMKDLPLSKVYQLLEPGPVVLLTTAQRGNANIMPMSWHMMVEFDPPQVACVVSNKNFSFTALRSTKECVIAVPDLKLARKVVTVGNCSGRDVNKFKNVGLTPLPAERVAPPLVAECFANLECRVIDTRLVRKFNLFVIQVLKAWIDRAQGNPKTIHHLGYGRFVVDGRIIRLKSRMR